MNTGDQELDPVVFHTFSVSGNQGATDGDFTVTVEPASGGVVHVDFFTVWAKNASGKVCGFYMDDGTNDILNSGSSGSQFVTMNASIPAAWPSLGGNLAAGGNHLAFRSGGVGFVTIAGDNRMILAVRSASASQLVQFSVLSRIRGGLPSFTISGTSGFSTTTLANRVED